MRVGPYDGFCALVRGGRDHSLGGARCWGVSSEWARHSLPSGASMALQRDIRKLSKVAQGQPGKEMIHLGAGAAGSWGVRKALEEAAWRPAARARAALVPLSISLTCSSDWGPGCG